MYAWAGNIGQAVNEGETLLLKRQALRWKSRTVLTSRDFEQQGEILRSMRDNGEEGKIVERSRVDRQGGQRIGETSMMKKRLSRSSLTTF